MKNLPIKTTRPQQEGSNQNYGTLAAARQAALDAAEAQSEIKQSHLKAMLVMAINDLDDIENTLACISHELPDMIEEFLLPDESHPARRRSLQYSALAVRGLAGGMIENLAQLRSNLEIIQFEATVPFPDVSGSTYRGEPRTYALG